MWQARKPIAENEAAGKSVVAIAAGLDTIIVRVIYRGGERPTTEAPGATSSGDDPARMTYHALVYSRLALPVAGAGTPPRDEPSEWSKEPLIGVEPFVVDWAQYNAYLASYVEGSKEAWLMQERLFEAIPAALSDVVTGSFAGGRPSRTWFHTDAPEVAELPWELLAYRGGGRSSTNASFARGLPPESATPLVPVTGVLRLGVIDPGGRTPRALTAAFDSLAPGIEVRRLSGGARDALQAAAAEGLELLHVVSDGSVTSSLEGVLEFPDSDERPLSAGELARYLYGSRVRVLGLTPCAGDDSASTSIGRRVVPAAHRAFTYFATSAHPLPTTVAPLGPLDEWGVERFWSAFYGRLGESHEIEASMAHAQSSGPVAVALFLRQLQVPTFRRVAVEERPSREAGDAIHARKQKLNLRTASLDAFVERESARQSALESEVSVWVEGVDEE
jgi:hypothetical protein